MSIPGIERWLESPQGRYVLAWERARIDATVSDIFGFNALQIGLPQIDLLAENRIPFRQKADDRPSGGPPVDVRCDLRALPFASNSIDLVLLPHVLEFHEDPHQVLREVERVLIPEGQLVLTGFNPLSLWGAARHLPTHAGIFPGNGRYLSVLRVKDWLQLLGFEVDRGSFGCYAPPCRSERWLTRWHFMEAAGDRWWGFAGGLYLLRAVKRVHGMRLLTPSWRDRRLRGKALSPVAQRDGGAGPA